jgi:hypothetical protein
MKKNSSRFPNYLLPLLILFSFQCAVTSGMNVASGNNPSRVLKGNIKSVLFFKEGFQMSAPVIRLNSQEKLQLMFDDLDSDLKSYRYTIYHCKEDWSSSTDLQPIDYIDGYSEDNIDNFAYSFNTTVHYTHYTLSFPTANLRPRISGNYILSVYTENSSDPSFVWRFRVYETTPVGVTGTVHQANNLEDRLTRQQLEFTVNLNGSKLDNPGRNIKIVISQNDRQDNELRNLTPTFMRAESLEYSNNDAISFDGGNEFRAFDIKSLIYQTERIKSIEHNERGIQVNLLDDISRSRKNYSTEKDINGRMLIKSEDHAQNSEIEADYAWVRFSLPFQTFSGKGQVFLLGALTNWLMDENSILTYDFEKKCYSRELFLKQGYYEYLYIFKNQVTGEKDISYIEGSHWETENEYTIWVYYQGPGDLYDRLIAVQNLNSIH